MVVYAASIRTYCKSTLGPVGFEKWSQCDHHAIVSQRKVGVAGLARMPRYGSVSMSGGGSVDSPALVDVLCVLEKLEEEVLVFGDLRDSNRRCKTDAMRRLDA